MSTQEIADRLHQLVEAGDYFTAYDELFTEDAREIEPQLSEMDLGEIQGIPAIKQKVGSLSAGIETLLSRDMSAPIVSANHIAFTNIVKAKLKDGNEMNLSEICLYEVQDGKMISEQFFY